jgi:hypothetical protein
VGLERVNALVLPDGYMNVITDSLRKILDRMVVTINEPWENETTFGIDHGLGFKSMSEVPFLSHPDDAVLLRLPHLESSFWRAIVIETICDEEGTSWELGHPLLKMMSAGNMGQVIPPARYLLIHLPLS